MKAINFFGANSKLLAGDIPDCDDLPVCKTGTEIISKWRMSWRERMSALFFGVAFVSVLTRGASPPIVAWVKRTLPPRR